MGLTLEKVFQAEGAAMQNVQVGTCLVCADGSEASVAEQSDEGKGEEVPLGVQGLTG